MPQRLRVDRPARNEAEGLSAAADGEQRVAGGGLDGRRQEYPSVLADPAAGQGMRSACVLHT
jgi:hypothetical protein